MIEVLVADTCSLVNFASVRRIDLLQDLYGALITCVEAVRRELLDLAVFRPDVLGVFALPLLDRTITFDDPADIAAIERLRRTALGGRARLPRQHLGEAQSLHAILTVPAFADAVLLTDDLAASDFARRHQVRVMDSVDVLSAAYDADLVGCPEAYEILLAMRAEQRWVRVPLTHYLVCPPVG